MANHASVPQLTPPLDSADTTGIAGWFDWPRLYDRLVDTAPPNSWLVEVGVLFGRSLVHLAHRAKFANANLKVVGVDWGRGSPEHRALLDTLPHHNLAGVMLDSLIKSGVADDVALILAPSVRATKFVPDGACHMVFLDADHSRDAVTADIEAWLPKVRPGGVLCGHDWSTHAGVRTAVCDVLGSKNHMVLDAPSCWAFQVGVDEKS